MSQSYELREALERKKYIIENVNSYYYMENIETKHRVRKFGIVVNPRYSYHQEQRFNEGKFRQDLAAMDAKINTLMNNINRNYDDYSAGYSDIVRENYSLNSQLVQANYEIQSTLQAQQEKEKVPAKLSEQQVLNVRLQSVTTSLEAQDKQLSQLETEQLKNITSKIQNSTEKMRAAYVASMYAEDNPLIVMVVNNILAEKVDYEELAWIAINRNDRNLLECSIEHHINLDQFKVNEKTLISHVLATGKLELIKLALASTLDYDCTAMLAIKQGDIATIKTLLQHKPELQYQLFGENTLLQHAVVHHKEEILKYLIELNPNIINIANKNGDSVFEAALIANAPDKIFTILSPYLNMELESAKIRNDNNNLLSKAIARGFIVQEPAEHVIDHLQQEEELVSQVEVMTLGNNDHYDQSLETNLI